MLKPNTRKVLGIIGPSGVGKSTIVSALAKLGSIHVNPTWTTRPRRADEQDDCLEHIFVTETEFSKCAEQGKFIEIVQMFGLPYSYGLPALTFDRADQAELIMLRAPLLDMLYMHYPDAVVYQVEDELTTVESRLKSRHTGSNAMGTRLKDYDKELLLGRTRADRIFANTVLDETVQNIHRAIIDDFGLSQ